jgi:hypothetical protein
MSTELSLEYYFLTMCTLLARTRKGFQLFFYDMYNACRSISKTGLDYSKICLFGHLCWTYCLKEKPNKRSTNTYVIGTAVLNKDHKQKSQVLSQQTLEKK